MWRPEHLPIAGELRVLCCVEASAGGEGGGNLAGHGCHRLRAPEHLPVSSVSLCATSSRQEEMLPARSRKRGPSPAAC